MTRKAYLCIHKLKIPVVTYSKITKFGKKFKSVWNCYDSALKGIGMRKNVRNYVLTQVVLRRIPFLTFKDVVLDVLFMNNYENKVLENRSRHDCMIYGQSYDWDKILLIVKVTFLLGDPIKPLHDVAWRYFKLLITQNLVDYYRLWV